MPEMSEHLPPLAAVQQIGKVSLVITTIHAPSDALRKFASPATEVILIGDEKTPQCEIAGGRYYSLAEQLDTSLLTAQLVPRNSYSRKNIGYLLAMRSGATSILESDDDNFPYADFFAPWPRYLECPHLAGAGWVNVYRYFTDSTIWPRGLALRSIRTPPPSFDTLSNERVDAPIQQGLVDDDPDVDAIYRLVGGASCKFRTDRRIALGRATWCPFNSQNTTWWPDAFCLLYLPSYCSFRATDIWRSFVAQRIAWENGWSVLFHGPTARQERNHHDLIDDFVAELPIYLHNESVCARLASLTLAPGVDRIPDNMRLCYAAMIQSGAFPQEEAPLLDAWLTDFSKSFHPESLSVYAR